LHEDLSLIDHYGYVIVVIECVCAKDNGADLTETFEHSECLLHISSLKHDNSCDHVCLSVCHCGIISTKTLNDPKPGFKVAVLFKGE